jgi:hypothetical protein
MENNTDKLIEELRHLAISCCEGSDFTVEHNLAGRAAIHLERLTKITITDYPIDDFRPLMRLAKQDYTTTARPIYKYAETFTCDDITFFKGEYTDFASVPVLGRLFAPQVSMYVGAAAKHDKSCVFALANKSYRHWLEASDTFHKDLLRCKTNKNRAAAMVAAVKLNGLMLKASGKLK